jgi:hypothetical protein
MFVFLLLLQKQALDILVLLGKNMSVMRDAWLFLNSPYRLPRNSEKKQASAMAAAAEGGGGGGVSGRIYGKYTGFACCLLLVACLSFVLLVACLLACLPACCVLFMST